MAKGMAFTTYISLPSQADIKTMQVNPTLADGDVKYSDTSNSGTLTNLATLPDVYPAGSEQVRVRVSASEANLEPLLIYFKDAAGAQWCSVTLVVYPSLIPPVDVTPANLTQILGTTLTETVIGYLAAGFKKLLDVASPVFTLASKNQSADNDTKLTAIQLDYARRTGDYSILTAAQVWAALTSGLVTPGSIGAWILDKLDVKVSSVSTGSIPTPAQIWQYAWRTLTTGSAKSGLVEESNTISVKTFSTLNYQISDLGSLANYTTIYFSVKSSKKDSDDDAILRISKNLSGVGDGLLRVLGVLSTDASKGSITIDDSTTGIITVKTNASIIALLQSGKYFADVKIIRSSGVLVEVLREFFFNLSDSVTKAIV